MSLDPATFKQLEIQMIKDSGHQAPEQGQTGCVVTAAEAMEIRADAVVVLLWGAAQALAAMLAVASASRVGTICAQLLSLGMAPRLADVLAGIVQVAIGRCHGHGSYHLALIFGYGNAAVYFGLLFIVGAGIALFSKVDG